MENCERYRLLQPYLGVSEQVLWSGSPCTTRRYRPNAFLLVFMIFWTGFAVIWTAAATVAGGFFGLFGIPFVVIGFVMLYLFAVAPRKKLPHTVYAVTDTRAILLIPSKSGYDITSYPFRSMPGVSISDMKADSGSIVFKLGNAAPREYGYSFLIRGYKNPAAVPTDCFLLIDGVNGVYRLIMDQIEAQK